MSRIPPIKVPGTTTQTPFAALPAVTDQASTAPRPGVSRRVVFSIVAIALLMTAVDASIVATALPAIHKSLRATINWTGWTITIFSLGMVAVLPIAGKVSDQFGRRRVFLFGVALFTFASLLCGFANDIYTLIVFRALQAAGGAAMQPSAAGIVADHFGNDRDRGLGMFGTIISSGIVIGPIFGGLFVGYLSWRWIFFVNVPVGIVLLGLIVRFIPESKVVARTKMDIRGLLLLVSCVLLANLSITSLGNSRTTIADPLFFVPGVCSIVLVWLFLRHTKRVPDPFIPRRLLLGSGFAAVNIVNLFWGIVGFGVATLIPLYAEQRYHLSALNAGTMLTARGVGSMAVGTIATFALRRTGYRLPLIGGYSLMAIGMLIMSASPQWGLSTYTWLSICAGIAGVGAGIANPASRNASLQLAPDDVAAVSGLRTMFNYAGVILSVAIVTAILNRSANPGVAEAHIFWGVAGIVFIVIVPLIFRVPEHKGSW